MGRINDELLAFVITCLFCESISKEELTTWRTQALRLNDAQHFFTI
jgi:hypothetical protein